MKLHFFHKILLIAVVLLGTYVFAKYERSRYYGNSSTETGAPVLKHLPAFNVIKVADKTIIKSSEFLVGSRGVFVHIWGTWCAPCEKEMPEFLQYAAKVESQGVRFLLIAVNDEEAKVLKFLKRFPNVPKNVTFAMDLDNRVMDQLGTLKVPETFLFAANGKHINKFIGPQEWMSESYTTRLNFWLNDQKLYERKIETH